MSVASTDAPAAKSAGAKSEVSDVVIRIAGNSQDGIQAMGAFLARLAGRSEQDVMTYMTIPSTISGGPSIFQVRIGTGEVVSSGDDADVLLAFYQHSYNEHIGALRKGGIVLYDSGHVTPNADWEQQYRHVAIPIAGLTVEAIGGTARDKGKNMYALGLVTKLFDLDVEKLRGLITEKFQAKDESVLSNAMDAFDSGYAYSLGHLLETFKFADSRRRGAKQVVMNGNEALAYGLVAAGVRFGAGYPITPWSDIMELLRRELPKYGGTFVQCEDEIASIAMALGASYAGRVAVTGSSGPGLSLKTEALGWGIMAEVPLVVVDVQRGGPSTGLPTNVEQSDLNIACFGGHGDSPRIVLAPANVEECFHLAIEAVNLARQYSVPVILLTDQAIATRIEAFPEPDLKSLVQDIAPDMSPVPEHKPYDLESPNGAARHRPPGTRILSGKYPIVTGLEHDEFGHPTASPALHAQMSAKRRRKLQVLSEALPVPPVYGGEDASVLLVGWGSTLGPIQEAVDRARAAGESVSAIHLRHLHPLPAGLGELFNRFPNIRVIEMNDEGVYGYGQLAGLLRARFCTVKIRGINKTDGLAFKVRDIVERIRGELADSLRKL